MAFGVGAITSKLLLDFSGFAGGFAQVQGIMGGFPAAVATLLSNPLQGFAQIAGAAMAAVKSAIGGVVESTHEVSVEAQRAGVSAGFLKQIGAAGKTVDLDIGSLSHSLAFLGKNASEAASGNETVQKAFAALGVSAVDAQGQIKPTEALFNEVADAIAKLPSPAQQTNAAMDLMSRGGLTMVPILKKGSEGIKEIAAEMKALSGGSPEGLAENAEKFHEAENKISAAMSGIKKAIAAPIIGAFADNADVIVAAMASIAKVLRESFGGAVAALAPAVGGFFKGLGGLAELVAGVVTPVFKVLQPILEGIGKALGFVFELIGKVLGGIGGFVKSVTDEFGLTTRGGSSFSSDSGGGGSRGETTNNINVSVTPSDSTLEIAELIRRETRAAERRGASAYEAQEHARKVWRGLEGALAQPGD